MENLETKNNLKKSRPEQKFDPESWKVYRSKYVNPKKPAPIMPDHFDFLREDQSRFYDFLPLGYLTLDKNGAIRTANSTAAEVLGVEKDLLINTDFTSYIHADDKGKIKFDRKNLSQLSSQSLDIRLHRQEQVFWVKLNIFFDEIFFFTTNR